MKKYKNTTIKTVVFIVIVLFSRSSVFIYYRYFAEKGRGKEKKEEKINRLGFYSVRRRLS